MIFDPFLESIISREEKQNCESGRWRICKKNGKIGENP